MPFMDQGAESLGWCHLQCSRTAGGVAEEQDAESALLCQVAHRLDRTLVWIPAVVQAACAAVNRVENSTVGEEISCRNTKSSTPPPRRPCTLLCSFCRRSAR